MFRLKLHGMVHVHLPTGNLATSDGSSRAGSCCVEPQRLRRLTRSLRRPGRRFLVKTDALVDMDHQFQGVDGGDGNYYLFSCNYSPDAISATLDLSQWPVAPGAVIVANEAASVRCPPLRWTDGRVLSMCLPRARAN